MLESEAADFCVDIDGRMVAHNWNDPRDEEIERLRAALQQIKDEQGKVCAEFEVCCHVACQSSVSSWMIADQALASVTAIPS